MHARVCVRACVLVRVCTIGIIIIIIIIIYRVCRRCRRRRCRENVMYSAAAAAAAERVAETLKHTAAVCVVYNINDAHAHTIVYY